jgi:hypothetical protein
MPYVSCQYAPSDPTGFLPEGRITCIDDNGTVWHLSEDSQVGDYLAFIADGGTIDPAEIPLEPGTPGGPALPVPERDYGAEIDALDARVTMLEARVLALESK